MNAGKNGTVTADIVRYIQIVLFGGLVLYFGKILFVPMFMGLLIAMVMYPVCKWQEARGFPRSVAITICLLIVIILFLALIGLLGWQIAIFRSDLPAIKKSLSVLLPQLQEWIVRNWGIAIEKQNQWIDNSLGGLSAGNIIQTSFHATTSFLFSLFITPIYSALFLYHRKTFVKALHLAVSTKYKGQLDKILAETTHTYFNYIKGLVLVYIIVGILNSVGLLALGIKHAVLFGMLTAIMTIIPYIGIIVSAMLPISIAFLTKDSAWYPIGVIGVFSFVQYLEANVIFPRVVGTQLNVSTWATLVAIVAGGVLWGVAGMILFIPFVAILKIITDNLEPGTALNTLLSR